MLFIKAPVRDSSHGLTVGRSAFFHAFLCLHPLAHFTEALVLAALFHKSFLGPFLLGSQLEIIFQAPEFDPRNYGFKKLGELAAAIGLFEVDRRKEIVLIRSRRR